MLSHATVLSKFSQRLFLRKLSSFSAPSLTSLTSPTPTKTNSPHFARPTLKHRQPVAAFSLLTKYSLPTDFKQDTTVRVPTPTAPVVTQLQNEFISFSAPLQMSAPSFVEAVVAKVTDLEDGQMKEVDLGENKILLVKEDGQFYATGNKCTHYGAPLSKGAYCKGVVRCPWHGACFNIKTGDIEDFPGMDSIHTFQVSIEGENVVVKANVEQLENTKRAKPMVKKSPFANKTAILVGGGPASMMCAQTLREEGFPGDIKIISLEKHLPYDRIKLSKSMSISASEIALRKKGYFETNDIELIIAAVTSVDSSKSIVHLSDGQSLSYNHLLIATGGIPRRLPISGSELRHVYFLRCIEDANAIIRQAKNKNVVIVGSSFIGMEVASSLAEISRSVQVVDIVSVPFQMTLGEKLGSFMQKMHEEKGVKFFGGTTVKELRGVDGHVTEAILSTGEAIPADVVIMGVGVVPATSFLKDSGLAMTKQGFVSVNKKMETNMPGIYAAGDITEFPLFIQGDKPVNIQHFQMAHKQGRIAALNIAGKPEDIKSVPYFWTVQYGKSIRYCGYGPGYEDIVLHGNLEDNKFVAFYTKGDDVVAVASLGWDPIVSQAAELLQKGGKILKREITKDPTFAWLERL